MALKKILFFFVLASIFSFANAQEFDPNELDNYSFKEKFEAANIFTLETNQYHIAIPIWENLLKEEPDNFNLNFKLGYCLLKTKTRSKESYSYLTKASNGINKNYSPIDFDEKTAPKETTFYLAQAYHLNHEFDKSTETFNALKNKLSNKHILSDKIDLGIVYNKNAKTMVASPRNYIIKNLGKNINSEYTDFSPVTTDDDNALFFTSRRVRKDSSNSYLSDPYTGEHFEDVYVSYRDPKTGLWGEATLIEEISTSDKNQATIGVSLDGETLFVYVDDQGDGNIYESKNEGGKYSSLFKLDGNINTDSWETHASISSDKSTIYFTSDREGGFGGRDIYKVEKLPNGSWSKAQNLGEKINTKYDEDAPYIHPDNVTLFYSSNNQLSMGNFDIFYTQMEGASWTTPVNMGYPLNTVYDDVFMVTTPSGKKGYYSSYKEDSFGEDDIYEIYLDTSYTKALALLKGNIIVKEEEKSDLVETKILVSNLTTGEGPNIYTPRPQDGGYIVLLEPCNNYLIDYLTNDKLFHSENISVPCDGGHYEVNKIIDKEKLQLVIDSSDIIKPTLDSTVYKKEFAYNKIDVSKEEERFNTFLSETKSLIGKDNMIRVSIEGSASRVPTTTWGNNFKLANQRTEEAKTIVLEALKNAGVDLENVIIETKSSVQGPEYKGDHQNTTKYGVFQYVKIKSELLKE